MGYLLVLTTVLIGMFVLLKRHSQTSTASRQASTEARSRASDRLPEFDPTQSAKAGNRMWIPMGVETKVAGYRIPGGMIYVGKGLPAIAGGAAVEPALIDPNLTVNRDSPDTSGESLGYWPSYSRLAPETRAGYLRWLADGRQDPRAPLGFIFLFFYGLERRLILDAAQISSAQKEAQELAEEIRRLYRIYGAHRSFRNYAQQLLVFVRFKLLEPPAYDFDPPPKSGGYELPLELAIPLGQLAKDRRPVPTRWALAWLLSDPSARLRTPATRCEGEFLKLFAIRYADRHGDGIVLPTGGPHLSMRFKPASASFGGGLTITGHDLPDVAALSEPLRSLREIAESSCDDLDGYSRLLGRSPDARDTLQALAYLPAELVEDHGGAVAKEIEDWIGKVVQAGGVADADEVLARWPGAKADKLTKREAVEFARLLEKFSHGMEPDVRFLGTPPARGGKVVLFELPMEHPATPSRDFLAATVLLHLAAVVAAADGTVSVEEEQRLKGHLEEVLHLDPAEQARLSAHLSWLLAVQPRLVGLKRRLANISVDGRAAIARFTVTVAAADGRIEASEIKTLRKIYATLDLDQEAVYADLHSLAAAADTTPPADQPVTVKTPGTAPDRFAVPAASGTEGESDQSADIRLDMTRVKERMAQTSEVSALLAGIFTEPEEAPSASGDSPKTTADGESPVEISGLDANHSNLLRDLSESSEWNREEFDTLADQHGLLPEGALETLNEAAFDAYDDALLEGDDPIEVNSEILKAMLA